MWDVGTMSPPIDRTFIVWFQAPSVAEDRDIVVTAEVSYTDTDGTPYPSVTSTSPIHITAPPGLFLTWLAVAIGVPLAVLFVLAFILWRRRRSHPPP